MEDNEFSQIVAFIKGYSSDNNICEPTLFQEIKLLFRQFLIQGRDLRETVQTQNERIEELERENTSLEKMAKEILSHRSEGGDQDLNSSTDTISISRRLTDKNDRMALQYEKQIQNYKEEINSLQRQNNFQEENELEKLKELNSIMKAEASELYVEILFKLLN